ncbi:MAG: hypothetical protein ACLUQ0_05520 [Enterococcus italicus]
MNKQEKIELTVNAQVESIKEGEELLEKLEALQDKLLNQRKFIYFSSGNF